MSYQLEDEALLTRYYLNQAGSGAEIYRGSAFQKGYGIGSWLGGLFRHIIPLLRKGGKALGGELLNTVNNVLDDVTHNGKTFETAIKSRGVEGIDNLKRKAVATMKGGGVNHSSKSKSRQSSGKPRCKQSLKNKAIQKKKNLKKKSIKRKKTTQKKKLKSKDGSIYKYF